MLKRGQDLIAAGDIASGRLMLTHLAEAGDAEASFILAGTFDAAVLAKLRVVGVQPDPAKARAWYAKAAEQGSLEAKQRLQQSALR
jgi:TPR repeat protein